MTTEKSSNKYVTANSYKELLNIVKRSSNISQEIKLKDIIIRFDLDFNKFLREGRFANILDKDEQFPMVQVTHLIVLDNISCNKINFTNIVFENSICIYGKIKDQTKIDNMTFYGCKVNCSSNANNPIALEITDIEIINKLLLENCIFTSFVSFYSITLNHEKNFYIRNCIFKEFVRFERISLYPKSFLKIDGEKALFSQDIMFVKCNIAGGLEIRSEITKNLCLYDITSLVEKKYHNNFLSLQDVSIGKSLKFIRCNFNTIDIINAHIYNIYEYALSYCILKADASVVFRAAAIKNNNEFLIQKYTAMVYDKRLKEGLFKPKYFLFKRHRVNTFRKLFNKYIGEPIILFINSFYSGERLLLWLNKYSNDFNRSWIRGIWFTTITALISYFMLNYFGLMNPVFVIDWKFNNFKIVGEGYLSLIDIFNLSGIKFNFQTNTLGKYIIFFARVFIAYGIYQTIYAFYKYKK